MSASDRVLGKTEAVLSVIEEKAAEVARLTDAVTALERRLDRIVPDVEQLRMIVPDLRDMIDSLRQTKWMTSHQLARHLSVHRDTVARWAREGVIPGHRLGADDWRFDLSEIDRAIKRAEFMHELARIQ